MNQIIKMANQIAAFFESQPGDRAAGIATHINENWSPDMRADLMAELENPALAALVKEAAPAIRKPAA